MAERRLPDLSFGEGFNTDRADAARNRGDAGKVFNWHKAAKIIRERQPKRAEAGLNGDWGCTGGPIYDIEDEDGDPTNCGYTYLCSRWASPQLEIDGERIDCWVENTPEANPEGWDSHTQWPDSALKILRGEDDEDHTD